MDLRHLRSFVAVADLLSFRRAAERLHLTRPPLTRQIMALEKEIGGRLLERSRSKAVSLTDAGQAFLLHAKQALKSVDAAGAAARQVAEGTRGKLAVTGCALLAAPVMGAYLKEFRRQFPHAEVSFVHATHAQELSALRDGGAQLALSATFGEPLEDGFESRVLATIALVAVLPDDHPLAQKKGSQIDLPALRNEVLVTPTLESEPSHAEFLNQVHRQTAFAPRGFCRVDGAANILGMVAAGYGMAILPACAVNAETKGCIVKRLRLPPPVYRLRMLWRRECSSPLLRNFLVIASRGALPPGYQNVDAKTSALISQPGTANTRRTSGRRREPA